MSVYNFTGDTNSSCKGEHFSEIYNIHWTLHRTWISPKPQQGKGTLTLVRALSRSGNPRQSDLGGHGAANRALVSIPAWVVDVVTRTQASSPHSLACVSFSINLPRLESTSKTVPMPIRCDIFWVTAGHLDTWGTKLVPRFYIYGCHCKHIQSHMLNNYKIIIFCCFKELFKITKGLMSWLTSELFKPLFYRITLFCTCK